MEDLSRSNLDTKETKCFCGFNHENRSSDSKERTNSSHRKHSQDWEKLKGVWNNILKSPLFNRRKKGGEKDMCKSSNKEEEPPRPPVSPLLLQRFLHQQIQHINAVRPFRSPSSSPKYSLDKKVEAFQYDEAWLDERERRGTSLSPPIHPKRSDQFGRHSSRNYRVSPSANWLVRSKSMAERSDGRINTRTQDFSDMKTSTTGRTDNHFRREDNIEFNHIDRMIWKKENRRSHGQFERERVDPFHRRPEQQFVAAMENQTDRKINKGQLRFENLRTEGLLDQRIDAFRLCKEDAMCDKQPNNRLGSRLHQALDNNYNRRKRDFVSSRKEERSRSSEPPFVKKMEDLENVKKQILEEQITQRMTDMFNLRLTDNKHPDQLRMEDQIKRRPMSPSKSSSSPEPPPRINKRVSPLLARRIAYNNSRLTRMQQSPGLPRRYMLPHQNIKSTDQNDILSFSRSSSLPCSPILSSRTYSYDTQHYPPYHDYTP